MEWIQYKTGTILLAVGAAFALLNWVCLLATLRTSRFHSACTAPQKLGAADEEKGTP